MSRELVYSGLGQMLILQSLGLGPRIPHFEEKQEVKLLALYI